MKKICEKCIHKKVCIDGANYKNADKCEKFADEELILRLPCKLGDTAYKLERCDVTNKYRIIETTIVSINISESETMLIEASANVFFKEELNKTVFLKREDAEKALKELKGEEISDPKLKPCPFCGSTKLKIDSKRTFNYNKRHCSVTVRCMKCHARSPVVGINLEKNQHNERELCESQVTEAWNSRSEGRETI